MKWLKSKIKILKNIDYKNIAIGWLEEIFFLLSFIILDIAMFLISIVAGLITLSIILFIVGLVITFIKNRGGLKCK
ncbi:MAG: DUF1056 family protein [Clostridium sp.]|nr:DUF1056 family protein [Clostridium sp.]